MVPHGRAPELYLLTMARKASRALGPDPTGVAAPRPGARLEPLIIPVLLALGTLIVFWPVTAHDFVNLDDPVYVTENPHVQSGITWVSLRWAFTNLEAGFWHPLTWLSIMLDCRLAGLRAGGHHLTSLLLHAASTALLFVILRRMTAAPGRSFVVAALFALHPLHVEPVAWASGRKDVLSTFFCMLTLLAYVRYVRSATARPLAGQPAGNGWRMAPAQLGWYGGALVLFVCALASKTMVVTLPLILLLLDWWPLRRFERATAKTLVLEKLPFFALSLLAGLLTLHAEHRIGALPTTSQFPAQFRVANAILSYARYLLQLFWPADLTVFYPFPTVLPAAAVFGAACLLLLVTALVVRTVRTRRYLAVGWFWYVLTLLPVIGLVQVGSHAHADRYTYIPLIGIFIMLTWGACDFAARWRQPRLLLFGVSTAAIVTCAVLARTQIAYWQDSEALFRHALQATRNNYIAHYNLGLYVSEHGHSEEAMEHYRRALEIHPAYGEAQSNLGLEIAKQGKIDEAITWFQAAIRSKPRLPSAHSNLGTAFGLQGRLTDAVKEYEESLRLKPDDARVHSNLANALGDLGKPEQAITHYQEALRLDPNSPEIHLNLGITLAGQGRLDEAARQYQEALRLKPDYTQAQEQLRALGAAAKR
jgi:protein O-mannosyl-transferase